MPAIYGTVHFNWVIDMYEEDLNSSWLLPNRLYEGSYCGAVPLAIEDVETGRYLKNLGIGVLLAHPLAASLEELLTDLPPEVYRRLERTLRSIPVSQWVCTLEDCKNLVRFIAELKSEMQESIHD